MSNSHQILQFLQQVSLHLLTPHPRNASIYGTDEDVSDLVELIAESNWVEPLVITPNYVIVSGHRRWKACQILRKENIPVVIREFSDDIAILKTLLLENASRHKTIEQRIREGIAWESIERDKARQRQGTRTDLSNIPANLPECSRGESRNAIAKRIGFSGRSYSKGRNIIERIDSELNEGNDPSAQALRSVLGKSIDAAHQLLAKNATERTCIAELMEKGKARSVSAAIRLIQKANSLEKQPSTLTNSEFDIGAIVEFVSEGDRYGEKAAILEPPDDLGQVWVTLENGLKHKTNTKNLKLVSSDSRELIPQTKTQSCWNCQHRLEAVDNLSISIYCNKFGILNLIDKSADDRGQECLEWKDTSSSLESKPTFVLKLLLPIEWQKELEEKAASLGKDPAVWVTNLISASLFSSSNFERYASDKANFSNDNYLENNQSNVLNKAIALTPPIAKIYDLHRHQARSNEQSFRGGKD
jgi:ParB family chromosome partitioning protein